MSFAAAIASNAKIIPATVPVKPIIGAIAIIAVSQPMFFSRKAISREPAFSIAFSTWSDPFPTLDKPALQIFATGPSCPAQTSIAFLDPPDFKAPLKESIKPSESTCD